MMIQPIFVRAVSAVRINNQKYTLKKLNKCLAFLQEILYNEHKVISVCKRANPHILILGQTIYPQQFFKTQNQLQIELKIH